MIKFSRKQLRIPYLVFLLVFVVLPLFVILYYALTNGEGQFTWENFREFFVDGKTMGTLFYSLMIAVTMVTVVLTTKVVDKDYEMVVTDKDEFEMSSDTNFIILLLDAMEGGTYNEVCLLYTSDAADE